MSSQGIGISFKFVMEVFMYKVISNSPEDTFTIGEKIGKLLDKGNVICLSGDLGVGKTMFVKGIAKGLGVEDYITSPTFTIVNEHEGKYILYHFDVYRVNDSEELAEIGFDEYIYSDGVSVIEWAELIMPILPKERLFIEIKKDYSKGEDYREIILEPTGIKYELMVKQSPHHPTPSPTSGEGEKRLEGSENNEGTCN